MPPHTCPPRERILELAARTLAPDDLGEIETHIASCRECRKLLVSLEQTNADDCVSTAKGAPLSQVGRYTLVQCIGQGGMGTVYAAHDPQLDRRVAIKIVRHEVAEHGGVERLVREGRALARLSHANVVSVFDAGVDQNRVYVVMELVDGQNLASWLRERPRDIAETVRMFVAAARGIAAAHRAGVIHRDVKPENVLVDRDGVAKVADFGLASHISVKDSDERLTMPNAVMGTPAFMSPEQRRGEEVGPATDQYSLCDSLQRALLDEQPRRKVPAWLASVLGRGLAPDAAARFPSMDDLVAALDVDARRRRRSRLTAVGVGVIGVVTLTAFGLGRVAEAETDSMLAACNIAGDERAALWTERDRNAAEKALLATNNPFAIEIASRVRRLGDRYTEKLANVEARVCAHAPRNAASRTVALESLACLDDRREAFARAIEALRASNVDTAHAVSAFQTLEAVEDCETPAILAENRAASATPLGAATRAQVKSELDAASRLQSLGSLDAAVAHARRAVELARPSGGVMLARALITLGATVNYIEGPIASEKAYREALTIAEITGADHVRAVAMVNMMNSVARIAGREKEALSLGPLAEAAIERTDKALLVKVHESAGIAKMGLGQVAEALADFQAALASARTWLAPDDPKLVHYLHGVALALGQLGRFDEADATYTEAVKIGTEAYGADHPETAGIRIHLVSQRAWVGNCPQQTLTELAQIRTALTGVLPADSVELLQISRVMSACHRLRAQYDEALGELRARQDVLVTAGRAKSDEMAAAWIDLGDVELARKNLRAARDYFKRALTETEALVGVNDVRVAVPLLGIGLVELAAKRPASAIAPVERALAVYMAGSGSAVDIAAAQLRLSYALGHAKRDRVRARQLAEAAREAFAAAGTPYIAERTEADAWLRTLSR
jgi:eukaryotic-like serine/threonine-protein kinase